MFFFSTSLLHLLNLTTLAYLDKFPVKLSLTVFTLLCTMGL